MKACPNCLRIKLGEDWQPEKLPHWYFMVKPYREYAWEICPECDRIRSGVVIPVCSNCLRIRNDAGEYIDCDFDRSACENATDGLCPSCVRKPYSDLLEEILCQTKQS